MKPHNVT